MINNSNIYYNNYHLFNLYFVPGIVPSSFINLNSFNLDNKPMRQALLLYTFHTHEIEEQKLNNLLQVTHTSSKWQIGDAVTGGLGQGQLCSQLVYMKTDLIILSWFFFFSSRNWHASFPSMFLYFYYTQLYKPQIIALCILNLYKCCIITCITLLILFSTQNDALKLLLGIPQNL